jgi:hypothetical protein
MVKFISRNHRAEALLAEVVPDAVGLDEFDRAQPNHLG